MSSLSKSNKHFASGFWSDGLSTEEGCCEHRDHELLTIYLEGRASVKVMVFSTVAAWTEMPLGRTTVRWRLPVSPSTT